MIPVHIAYLSYDAQGRPIDPATIGDVFHEGWALAFTGPNDAGLVRKDMGSGGQTQLLPSTLAVSDADLSDYTSGYFTTASPVTNGDTNGFADIFYFSGASTFQLTHGDGASGTAQYLSNGANGFAGGVAFESQASNLVAGDTNGVGDIFVRQVQPGSYAWLAAQRVSVTTTGAEANGASYGLVAADWRPIVLFTSEATNLVGDGEGGLFWKGLATGILKRADALADGTRIAGAGDADISAYGRYVVFTSTATTGAEDTNGVIDVFLRDMETGSVTRVSTAGDGSQLSFATANPSISSEGRFVAFEGQGQVWVKDVQTGELLKLTDTASANHIVGFQGTRLVFEADGAGVLPGVQGGGLFVASLGSDTPVRSGVTATSTNFTIPNGIDQAFTRADIGGYTITGNALDNYFDGAPVGNTFIGGDGDDIFDMDRAGNTLTGGAGSDLYMAVSNPYGVQTVTDFKVGEDVINLDRALAGRGGSDPTVDGYIRLESDGAGGTRISLDADGFAGSAAPIQLFTLKNVPVSSVTWANLTSREGADADHAPVLSASPGGAAQTALGYASTSENALAYYGTTIATGSLYVRAADGIDDLTVGGHAIITDGVFQPTNWTTALGNRIEFVSFDPTNGKVTFNYELLVKQYHPYAGGLGDDSVYDYMPVALTDRDGDQATGQLQPSVRDDYPSTSGDLDIVDRNDGRSSGNVITGVRDADTQFSSGVDRLPIDGGAIGRIEIANTTVRDDTPDAAGNFTIQGSYGTLTMNLNGDYTYELRTDAPSTGGETFRYWLKDGDGRPLHEYANLEIRFSPDAPGADGGQVITSPGPGSTVAGGPGNDTLNASNGADTLTGGSGSDVFAWAEAPTATARITDFRPNYSSDGDRVDLSKVLQSVGYGGSDPVGDGYLRLVAADGGSNIVFDQDGSAGPASGVAIIKLDNIAAGTSWDYIGGRGYVSYWAAPQTLARPEGDAGVTEFTFTINRSNGINAGESTVVWGTYAIGQNPASGDDFAVGYYPSGEVRFAPGETAKSVTIQVAGDTIQEAEDTFQVRLLSSSDGGYTDQYGPIGYIGNDDGSAPPPPPADGGRVINSPGPGSTLTGGEGADTLNASQGSDILTGGAGADVFRWGKEPWSPATVTDFIVGSDRLDLSALFQASGYSGSNPVGDQYISLTQQGSDTLVLFDRDATGTAQQWPNYIIKLQGVSNVTWSQLSGDAPGGGGPSVVTIGPATVSHPEGQSGLTAYSFTLTRTGDLNRFETTHYQVGATGVHPADAGDFKDNALPNVSFTWEKGEASRTITVEVKGDAAAETDETFAVRLVADPGGTAVGAQSSATGTIVNDDGDPGGGTPGQVYTSPAPGSTLSGGAGDDTFNGSEGADVLTGNGGADVFAWADIPWSAARVTDFTAGTDRVDLSGIFQDIGYTGSDPVADGYVVLVNSFDLRSTHLYVDADGPGAAHQWDGFTVTLEGIYGGGTGGNRSSLTWTQVAGSGPTGGGEDPPPPSAEGQVLTSQRNGDTLTGGAGADTLNASQGPDRLTGGGGDDHFVFAKLVWNSGVITDFSPGHDKIDLSALFDAYPQGVLETRIYGNDTEIYFDQDGAGGEWPIRLTTIDSVTPSQMGSGWLIQ